MRPGHGGGGPVDRARAAQTIALYPRPRAALLPLLWQVQEEDGWVTPAAMRDIAEVLSITPAEVLGTASFYTMFKRAPTGRYLISVCRGLSCMWLGGEELLEHLRARLDVTGDSPSADGLFSVEAAECLAFCDNAPCLQVNYLFAGRMTAEAVDALVADLRGGREPGVLVSEGLAVGSHPGA